MTSNVWAISAKAEEIALWYSKNGGDNPANVSKGIIRMKAELEELYKTMEQLA